MQVKTIGAILAIIVVIGLGWYLLRGTAAPSSTNTVVTQQTNTTTAASTTTNTGATTASTTVTGSVTTGALTTATVIYTNQGFSPANVTVPKGGSVTFVNQSTTRMWVASNNHPDHVLYSGTTRTQHCPDTAGTAFDECAAVNAGSTYTFVFQKTGAWKYHNHARDEDGGTVTVTAK